MKLLTVNTKNADNEEYEIFGQEHKIDKHGEWIPLWQLDLRVDPLDNLAHQYYSRILINALTTEKAFEVLARYLNGKTNRVYEEYHWDITAIGSVVTPENMVISADWVK